MKLLIPTDFSSNAEDALSYALSFARVVSGEINLLHAIHPTTNNAVISGLNAQELNEISEEAEKKFKEIVSAVKSQNSNLHISYSVGVGAVDDVVNEKISELKADMVIMGTRGASGLKKIILGSNAASVIESVDVPVLAIPAGTKFSTPKKIMFATNYYKSDVEVIERLIEIAKLFGAEIIISHIIDEDEFDEDESLYLENCAKLVKQVTHFNKISHKIYRDHDVKEGIDELVVSENADWLALSCRKRSFLEKLINKSLTKEISYTISIPLLSYKINE